MPDTHQPSSPPDVVDLLYRDHERITLHLLETMPEGEPQSDLERVAMESELLERLRNLKDEIEAHLYIEEHVVYPFCSKFDAFSTLITRCHEEHRTARAGLMDALQAGIPNDRIRKMLHSLKADLKKHFKFEEEELFSLIRRQISRSDREELGKQLELTRLEWRRVLKKAA